MWHDSQWLPRFASWTESGRKRVVSLVSESWISPLLDHPRSANISLFALLALSRDSTVSPFSSRASSSLARFSSTGNANTGLIGLIRSCPTLGIFLPVYQKVSFFAPKSDKFLSHLLPPDDYSSVILSKIPRVYTEYRREVARINCVSHPEFFNSHPLFNPSALSAAFLFFFGFGTKVVKSFLSELNWARIDNTVFPPDVAPFKRRQSFRSAAITRGKRWSRF